jgi:hypothetical protein
MIKNNVLTAMNDGYDIILEGIFSTKSYANDFMDIIRQHPDENYIFYFDISLDETIRRHQTRPSRNTPTYTEGDLRTFYPKAYEPIHESEDVIPETASIDETLAYIITTSRL